MTKFAIHFAQVHPPFPPWESADFLMCFLVSFARFICSQRFYHLSLRSSRSHVFEKSAPCTFFLILHLSSGVRDKTEISSFPFIAERCAPVRELSTLRKCCQKSAKISAIFNEKIEIRERCKGVHCVDLGESFPTSIYLQNLASIQPRTSPEVLKLELSEF